MLSQAGRLDEGSTTASTIRNEQSEDIDAAAGVARRDGSRRRCCCTAGAVDLGHGFHATKQGDRYTLSESARRTGPRPPAGPQPSAVTPRKTQPVFTEIVRRSLHRGRSKGGGYRLSGYCLTVTAMDDLQQRAIRLIAAASSLRMLRRELSGQSSSSITSFGNIYARRPDCGWPMLKARARSRLESLQVFRPSSQSSSIGIRIVCLWRLIIGQPKLGGIVEGLNFLLPDWPDFERVARPSVDCER